MNIDDFKIRCHCLLMKKYDGTMCGNAPHYNWVEIADVNISTLPYPISAEDMLIPVRDAIIKASIK